MGSLKDLMSDDLVDVFLNEEDFAEAVTYKPDGAVTAFNLVVAIGDVTDQMVQIASGRADQQQISATAKLSLIVAGILAIEGVSRQPQRGDQIIFATGEHAGTWSVQTASVDNGGGVVMTLQFEQHHEALARDVAGGN